MHLSLCAARFPIHPDGCGRGATTALSLTPRAEKAMPEPSGAGSGLKFVGETVGADGHGRSAFGADAIDVVLAADVVRSGGEINPLAIAGPRVELFHSVVEGETFQLVCGKREDINVAAAGARRHEGQFRAVGRIERTRLLGRMCDQNMGFAAG